ncbi:hypothetical protein M404DRAFT_992016 [Pisolithus tinctorius Marx 270]|uniref:Uncharacterized protein n=1 Tax=Pisolithus tinctorius Marx 270 TaxID=870435 RepID=A0A0C3PXP4_PISTI|nr:hypothetical protein M404DRAFT_992016 [Pisolithus tinctorius Marx 270]
MCELSGTNHWCPQHLQSSPIRDVLPPECRIPLCQEAPHDDYYYYGYIYRSH